MLGVRASIKLWIVEAFEWREAKPSASLTSRMLSKLPKRILNSIDVQLKHRLFFRILPLPLYSVIIRKIHER